MLVIGVGVGGVREAPRSLAEWVPSPFTAFKAGSRRWSIQAGEGARVGNAGDRPERRPGDGATGQGLAALPAVYNQVALSRKAINSLLDLARALTGTKAIMVVYKIALSLESYR